MKTYTIENETNNITAYATKHEAIAVPDAEPFSSAEELAKLATNWPVARLVEIWNSLPGVAPVKKFTDRKTAATRIWKAIQSLGEAVTAESAPEVEPAVQAAPQATLVAGAEQAQADAPAAEPAANVSEQAPDIAPAAATATTKATQKAKAPTGETVAKAPREGSKTDRVIAMLKQEGGTTLEAIMTAMGWQKHTTRAMLSAGGSVTKNHGLVVTSEKTGDTRTYSIKA
jgi:hypothetical protein